MKKYPFPGSNVEQVFDSYCEYLAYRFGNTSQQLKSIVDRHEASPEPPRAEAVIFTWLSNTRMNPDVNEDPSTGGIDFLCRPSDGHEFFAEVHCVGTEALAADTGLPTKLEHLGGGAFGMPTELLQSRIKKKMEQLANAEFPRVLIITSEHPMAHLVFGPESAKHLFLSTPRVMIPFDPTKPEKEIVDLKNSAFFKPDLLNPGGVRPARQAASAVILVSIAPAEIRPIGLLHPEPAKPLRLDVWYETPFMQLQNWPITNGRLGIEWTMPPDLPPYIHQRLRLAKKAQT